MTSMQLSNFDSTSKLCVFTYLKVLDSIKCHGLKLVNYMILLKTPSGIGDIKVSREKICSK